MVRAYKRKPGRVNPDKRMARAVELRAEGLSLRQIAERLACSVGTVHGDLQRWESEQIAQVLAELEKNIHDA